MLTMRGNLFFDNETVHLRAGNEYREISGGEISADFMCFGCSGVSTAVAV